MSIERELRGNWDSVYYPAPEPMVDQAMAPGQQPGDVLVAEAGSRNLPESAYSGEPPKYPRMEAYDPTTREKLSNKMQTWLESMGVDRFKARQNAQTFMGGGSSNLPLTMGIADIIPYVGTGLQTEEAIRLGSDAMTSAQQGNYGTAALQAGGAAVGLLPGIGSTAQVTKKLLPKAGEMIIKGMDNLGSPVMMNAVPPSPSAAGAATKAMAPASDIGFYSAVEKAALNVQRNSGSGQAFLNDITKGENVKLDEIKWMGLDDFLKGKKNVTKQEVQDFVQSNRVDVQEVALGGDFKPMTNPEDAIIYLANQKGLTPNQLIDEYGYKDKNDYVTLANDVAQPKPSKFGKYTLPGGENYREILLTLPRSDDAVKAHSLAQSKALSNREKAGDLLNKPGYMPTAKDYEAYNLAEAEWNRLRDMPAPASNQYKSGHFDEKNVLAHMRVNDRVDADGKKMLLIEEVQSDWHQAGREKGYTSPEADKAKQAFADYSNELADKYDVNPAQNIAMYGTMKGIKPEEIAKYEQLQSAYTSIKDAVPDAPFKDTWYQLALKRALRYAADNGYDRVGLTTGKQQVERYDLAKQVDEIIAKRNEDGTFNISATMVDGGGSEQSVGKNIPVDKLPDYVGKDLAKSIQVQEFGTDVYSGDQLKVGGEGMKKYYDDVYPKFLEKYGKKWGASVGQIEIGLPPRTSNSFAYFRDWFAENHSNVGTSASALSNWEQGSNNKYVKEFDKFRKTPTQQEPVRYIDITPEMRKSVQKGQPLAAVSSESTVA